MRLDLSKKVFVMMFVGSSFFAVTADATEPTKEQIKARVAQMNEELDRDYYVGFEALAIHCKKTNPQKSAIIDANWKKNIADLEPPSEGLKKFMSSDAFRPAVAERVKVIEGAKGADREAITKMCEASAQ
jgi:hypothetical protein